MITVFDKDNKFIFLLYLFIFSILSSKREMVFICFSILYEKLVKLCPFMFWTNFHNLPKLCSFMFWKNGFKNKNFKLCSFMFWNNEGIKMFTLADSEPSKNCWKRSFTFCALLELDFILPFLWKYTSTSAEIPLLSKSKTWIKVPWFYYSSLLF